MTSALLFDLDDTLYPERQFVRSGFHAVAAELERRVGASRRAVLATLLRALRDGNRGQALQALCAQHELPATFVPDLIDVIRAHVPRLTLPLSSARALAAARDRGWRLGVVTNGPPAQQARKVEALGLASIVDTVVYAHACGDRTGKPGRAPFQAALTQLGVLSDAAVFVGDDPWCDIGGARRAGLWTILLCRRANTGALPALCEPDVTVHDIGEVIAAAGHILGQAARHVPTGRKADDVEHGAARRRAERTVVRRG